MFEMHTKYFACFLCSDIKRISCLQSIMPNCSTTGEVTRLETTSCAFSPIENILIFSYKELLKSLHYYSEPHIKNSEIKFQ